MAPGQGIATSLNPANWAGGVIDDSFAGVTFTTHTTLYLSANRTTAPPDSRNRIISIRNAARTTAVKVKSTSTSGGNGHGQR